jgi:AcrR family transcriptional regulator
MQRSKAEMIKEAAVRVFAGEGFHRARMDAIAHEAGVAV